MVKLEAVQQANKALVRSQPLVAVFVGATSGIGEYTVKALARTHGTYGKGLRVYLVGRNEKQAKAIIDECLKLCPEQEFYFVAATDLSLLRNVDQVSASLEQQEKEKAAAKGQIARIDILVMTQAYLRFNGRQGKSTLQNSQLSS
jgi:NAD(P)-dependent dehydrogenase (short-subunit alcohol dehydrogenase family)